MLVYIYVAVGCKVKYFLGEFKEFIIGHQHYLRCNGNSLQIYTFSTVNHNKKVNTV